MINANLFILKNLTRHNDEICHHRQPHHLNKWHHLALLFITIFGTYYLSIFHGSFIQLDDMNIISRMINEPTLVIKDLFFPNNVTGYYRPMIELSYRLDYFLWFDGASGWHLTNVTLHAVNTSFVYLISLVLFTTSLEDKESAAFCSALLYGLNPLATEAVCWIAGRSELILGFFMLSSFWLYLIYKIKRSYLYLLLSGILFYFAVETKETALALPVLIVIFEFFFKNILPEKKKTKIFITIACYIFVIAMYFLFFRRAGVDTANMHVGVGTSGLRKVSVIENVMVLFASLGYYIKKILIPWPLMFAIDSINLVVYSLLGVGALFLFLLRERLLPPLFRFFVAWVLISVSPAIAAAVLHIPWVPWAERYLYIPLVGFSLALVGAVFILYRKNYSFLAIIIFVLLTGLFWVTTLHRNYIWADEVRLWEDTTQNSDYGPVHYYYGKVLLANNRVTDGIEQMKIAIVKGFSYYPYLALSNAAFEKGDYEVSEGWLKKAILDYPQKPELHTYLADIYLRRSSGKADSRKFLLMAIDEYVKYAAVMKNDATVNLKVAQLYNVAQEPKSAVPFLERAIEINNDSTAAQLAMKYLEKLRKGQRIQ